MTPVAAAVPAAFEMSAVYVIVSPGSALPLAWAGYASVIVAVMFGAAGGGGAKGVTSVSLAEELILPLLLVFEEFPSLTLGLPTLRAMAASGVISIENDSKQATNTLRLLGAGLGDNFITMILFLEREGYSRLLPGDF